mmetsp:Transcript_118323/g.331409  ORF Transcript_118323/g.331409 Transcript_118323/m.331409 type:complete len:96 (+) Transcript_118323:2-289(+)
MVPEDWAEKLRPRSIRLLATSRLGAMSAEARGVLRSEFEAELECDPSVRVAFVTEQDTMEGRRASPTVSSYHWRHPRATWWPTTSSGRPCTRATR